MDGKGFESININDNKVREKEGNENTKVIDNNEERPIEESNVKLGMFDSLKNKFSMKFKKSESKDVRESLVTRMKNNFPKKFSFGKKKDEEVEAEDNGGGCLDIEEMECE